MSLLHSFLIVLITALATLSTRAVPFLLFGNKNKPVPKTILLLGKVLPPAVMATLVVYSLKHISFGAPSLWENELIGVAVTVAIHLWRGNTLLSIGIGTIAYMVLVQGKFF